MTHKQTYDIQKDNRIIIELPLRFRNKKRVRVIIEDIDEEIDTRILQLKKASKDPLFLADINEVTSDFMNIDKEHEI